MGEASKQMLIVFGLLIIILSFLALLTGWESEVVGETPCVDGINRINLEGIMCEDEVETWFGLNAPFCLLILIPSLLGMCLILKGMEGVV